MVRESSIIKYKTERMIINIQNIYHTILNYTTYVYYLQYDKTYLSDNFINGHKTHKLNLQQHFELLLCRLNLKVL